MKKLTLGKSFADRVRAVVRAIPKGETLSYGEVAYKAGAVGAARAVGTIMRDNYDKSVPCHRVIRADGKVGEYNRGGPTAKRALLRKEGVLLALIFFVALHTTVSAVDAPPAPHMPTPSQIHIPALAIPVAWTSGFLAPIETWRLKEVEYFTTLRTYYQTTSIDATLQSAGQFLAPEGPGSPGLSQTQQPDQSRGMAYMKFVGVTALASFFAHQFFFYVALVLIALFMLRFFLRLFI